MLVDQGLLDEDDPPPFDGLPEQALAHHAAVAARRAE
jgi:hypothetical protein